MKAATRLPISIVVSFEFLVIVLILGHRYSIQLDVTVFPEHDFPVTAAVTLFRLLESVGLCLLQVFDVLYQDGRLHRHLGPGRYFDVVVWQVCPLLR